MATWAEIKNFIRQNYIVSAEEGNTLKLEFNVDANRSQLVFVMGLDTGDEYATVRFFSAFATKDDLSPTQFMEIAKDPIYGVAEFGGLLGYMHNALMADIDASEISLPLNLITAVADETEKSLGLGDRL